MSSHTSSILSNDKHYSRKLSRSGLSLCLQIRLFVSPLLPTKVLNLRIKRAQKHKDPRPSDTLHCFT
ncbi:hypothetical protein Hamer_G008685 [Homarus americanus]|uniref:Uncharacterized protein n=1 Tax=Homarus americanus TaxID=6706 RepID=A0A8J5N5G9_HOMAM|nr:hypothetical protein Hamer_G008685 [Homarus americanus]